jgi:hypothetical protein
MNTLGRGPMQARITARAAYSLSRPDEHHADSAILLQRAGSRFEDPRRRSRAFVTLHGARGTRGLPCTALVASLSQWTGRPPARRQNQGRSSAWSRHPRLLLIHRSR